jgi:hypothetical protein
VHLRPVAKSHQATSHRFMRSLWRSDPFSVSHLKAVGGFISSAGSAAVLVTASTHVRPTGDRPDALHEPAATAEAATAIEKLGSAAVQFARPQISHKQMTGGLGPPE